MVLERGASLSKGVRRTGVEGSFGVVRTAQNTIGTSVANLSQTVDKINQFQVDVMDKEWQNNFDTNSALFIEEAMREELNSPNPDLVKLREKFITYRDTTLREAPQRFQNYIENKLDLNFVDAVNNVKDYANDLKYVNLSTQGAVLAETNYNSAYSAIQTIIKNNKGNFEKIQNEIDLYYTTTVLPNLANLNANDKILNKLKPLEMTPAMIEDRANGNNVLYESLRAKSIIEMMVSGVDFEQGDTQKLRADLETLDIEIDNYIQKYLEDPAARRLDMSDATVSEIVADLKAVKNNLLSVQSDKIARADNAGLFTQQNFSKSFIDAFKNDARLSIVATPKSILEQLNNTPDAVALYNNPELFFQTLNGAIEASSVHKIIASKKEQNNGVLPNMGDMLSEVNLSTGSNLSEDELASYVYASYGGLFNYDTNQMLQDYDMVLNNPRPNVGAGGMGPEILQAEKNTAAAAIMMQNGYFPPGLDGYFSQVDRIMMKPEISDIDMERVNQSIQLYNFINNNSSDVFFPSVTGADTPSFFSFLKLTKGDMYQSVNISDIQDLRQLKNEYKAFVDAPYDLEEIKNVLIDNGANVTLDNVQVAISEDLRSQIGPEAFGKFLINKLPYIDIPFTDFDIGLSEDEKFTKTEEFEKLLAPIPEWKKIIIGMSVSFGGEEYFADNPYPNFLQVDPIIMDQFNDIFVQELRKLGVDFGLIQQGKKEQFLQQVGEKREQALYSTAYRLNREGFGISNYESMSDGGKLVMNPLESKIPYSEKIDKEIYITAHIFQHIKSMENKYGTDKMVDMYPGLYINNFGTNQANRVDLDINRVNELLNDGVFYFIREPGDVYSYNLNPNKIYSNSYDLAMDVDDPQFLKVDDSLTVNDGQIYSKKAIVTEAVQNYLQDNDLVDFFVDRGVPKNYVQNFLYSILYPGTKAITTRKDLLEYLENNKIDIDMFNK